MVITLNKVYLRPEEIIEKVCIFTDWNDTLQLMKCWNDDYN